MGENTKIEWATHTFNPWIGCTKVGPGCDNCYAEKDWDKRHHRVHWGAGNARSRTSKGYWKTPFRLDERAQADGTPATVFCLSLGDVWDNEVDPLWRRDLFEVIERTPNLVWLLLSKRIGNATRMCDGGLPRNAALGATMVTQEEWTRDAPKLAEAKDRLGALFSFASVEPMLERIDAHEPMPDWVICGGESGGNARLMHPDWAESLRDQCKAAGAAFFMKQMTKKAPIPANLLVREFPQMAPGQAGSLPINAALR